MILTGNSNHKIFSFSQKSLEIPQIVSTKCYSILNPSRRDTDILHYTFSIFHYSDLCDRRKRQIGIWLFAEKKKAPGIGGFDDRTQNARRHICSEKGKRRTVPKSVLVSDHSSSSDSGPRICGLLGSLQWLTGVAFHCPSTAAWYRWDMPIPKHCDLSCILPHLYRKCNGFYWFYLNSAMIDGKIEISFSISSSVVSWQREMRTEPSMRVGSTPIASNT